ncbi:MAG TPA: hypothetical protein PK239_07765 [Chitinophagales bacterium]|nr:hypothetical protein [Chitinophagales bacterium]HRK27173.1 hypothetical protein [Chitinophagales bacterium]
MFCNLKCPLTTLGVTQLLEKWQKWMPNYALVRHNFEKTATFMPHTTQIRAKLLFPP